MADLSRFADLLRLLGGTFQDRNPEALYVPPEVRGHVVALGKICSALGSFLEQVHVAVYHATETRELVQQEARVREIRDQQMRLAFKEERSELVQVGINLEKKFDQMSARLEEKIERVSARANAELSRLSMPQPNLAAAHDALATLRQIPSEGAPREVVEVLRRLDASLQSEHVERTSRKLGHLWWVVQQAEALVDSDLPRDQTQDLREALEELRALD